jgi:hypothetical protein
MKNQISTTEQLNNLIEFRQKIYQALSQYGDAQFELVDGLLSSPRINSFAEISLSPLFQRGWNSAYAAIENGQQQEAALSQHLCQYLAGNEIRVYAVDSTVWPHPSARTLAGLMYAYSPSKAKSKRSVVKGHIYSLLTWNPERGSSWALPLDSQRVMVGQTVIETGVIQVKAHCRLCQEQGISGLMVITVDGQYGTHRFLRPLRDENCLIVARLRRDRVLYGPPPTYQGLGRPRLHGDRFAFKEPDRWPEPDEQYDLTDERWGQVRLRGWYNLHPKQAADTPFTAIYAEVRLERDKRPTPIWLAFAGETQHSILDAWRWFDQRWPIEPSIRFRKQHLHWTRPAFQQAERCDRWTRLVDLTYWHLFLARHLVYDQPLPWQRPLVNLTPGRIRQSLGVLFALIGSPTRPVQPRGKSPGWPSAKPRTRPRRYKPFLRGKKSPKTA